jgi:hypothetical protein
MSAAAELTKAEQETILLTSEADNTVSVYTFNRKLKERLKAYSQRFPNLCRLIEHQGNGSVTYEVDKSRVSIHLLAPTTEKQQRANRGNLCAVHSRPESNL